MEISSIQQSRHHSSIKSESNPAISMAQSCDFQVSSLYLSIMWQLLSPLWTGRDVSNENWLERSILQ
uniref:Uncharacterized protein n=1 Tax=Rhizophora mucronata TaxID=61149 RepID=A0A2P2KMT2_RHIMU